MFILSIDPAACPIFGEQEQCANICSLWFTLNKIAIENSVHVACLLASVE